MKRAILLALITTAIVLLLGTPAGALAADRVRDGVTYDVKAEQVFVGTVHGKPTLFAGRMYFTLWTHNGAVAVEIGPKEFVERNGFKLSSGQMISVVGMPIVISHREMVLAREITIGGSVFVVRDRNGEPMWLSDRPVQLDPDVSELAACQFAS
jgi:hypothetical protein